ncbi:MAG: hypothetical protein N2C14_27905, partial [Planctomycetales bacterium]
EEGMNQAKSQPFGMKFTISGTLKCTVVFAIGFLIWRNVYLLPARQHAAAVALSKLGGWVTYDTYDRFYTNGKKININLFGFIPLSEDLFHPVIEARIDAENVPEAIPILHGFHALQRIKVRESEATLTGEDRETLEAEFPSVEIIPDSEVDPDAWWKQLQLPRRR